MNKFFNATLPIHLVLSILPMNDINEQKAILTESYTQFSDEEIRETILRAYSLYPKIGEYKQADVLKIFGNNCMKGTNHENLGETERYSLTYTLKYVERVKKDDNLQGCLGIIFTFDINNTLTSIKYGLFYIPYPG